MIQKRSIMLALQDELFTDYKNNIVKRLEDIFVDNETMGGLPDINGAPYFIKLGAVLTPDPRQKYVPSYSQKIEINATLIDTLQTFFHDRDKVERDEKIINAYLIAALNRCKTHADVKIMLPEVVHEYVPPFDNYEGYNTPSKTVYNLLGTFNSKYEEAQNLMAERIMLKLLL